MRSKEREKESEQSSSISKENGESMERQCEQLFLPAAAFLDEAFAMVKMV
jgi:hypothetical protein